MSAWSDRHSDAYKQGQHDFERGGRYGYDRDLYDRYASMFDSRRENYTGGFEDAKREEERREERRQEETAEEARRERMAAQRAFERQEEERAEYERVQEELQREQSEQSGNKEEHLQP